MTDRTKVPTEEFGFWKSESGKLSWLCRLRLHRWRFIAPMISGAGNFEQCSRCRRRRAFFWLGGYVYED